MGSLKKTEMYSLAYNDFFSFDVLVLNPFLRCSIMLLQQGMACYIVSRLQDKLVSENVREVISMYSLARRAELPSDLMIMPPCELDPGGGGVV